MEKNRQNNKVDNTRRWLDRLIPAGSPVQAAAAVTINLLMIYVVYSLARVEYLVENWSYFSQSVAEGHLWKLMRAGLVFDTPGIFYTNALYILMMLFPLKYKENGTWYKACKWMFIVVNSLALFINLADSVYFSYTNRRTAWSIFSEFSNEDNTLKVVGTEMLRHIYVVLLFAVIVWGMWRLYVTPRPARRARNLVYYSVMAVSLIVGAVTAISGIRGGLLNHWYNYLLAIVLAYAAWRLLHLPDARRHKIAGIVCGAVAAILLIIAPIGGWRHRDIRPIAISNANAYASRPIEAALILNTPFNLIRSIGNVPFHDPHFYDDKAELEQIYTPLQQAPDSITPHRKNLCILIIESYGKEYIGSMNKNILGPDYKGFTPFTDSLVNHAAWWEHSYDNGRKSIDAMPSILAGIPMFVRPFIVTPQSVNKLKGIPALLGEMGYSTAFFHGARTGSMGFDGFARSIGFDNYYGREDFRKDPRTAGDKEFDGYWAIWDEPFMQWFAWKMTDMKQPFMTALFTASNHHPFRIPEKYKDRFTEGELLIHKTAAYTDNALRQFFNEARKQPWYENTIFIITNDHTNMTAHDEYRSDIGTAYGPLIIYDPSGEITPGCRDGIAQQTDIMPTMLNYLGYKKPYVAFGVDLFDTPTQDTWAVNYNNSTYQYVTEDLIWQMQDGKAYAAYSIDDHKMGHNILSSLPADKISRAENEIKALIQQYMDRMLDDRLTAP